jgi:hypothetical protein
MKMGGAAVAMATTLMVMTVSMMHGADAQGPSCLTVSGAGAPFGDATANCADVGNDLNQVLAQCNVLNEVQGVYSPDGTSDELFYLTSASQVPS